VGEPSFTTWDGLPVARDRPHGSSVVVRRSGPDGADGDGTQVLVLHRAANGVDYEGEWAWTTPAGARLPGEPVAVGAARELFEEAGLAGADVWPVDLSGDWAVWACDVPVHAPVTLHDAEHDRFEWLPAGTAARRCLPAMVGHNVARAAGLPRPPVTVRPAAPTDLDEMLAWRATAHVERRFGALDDCGRAELSARLAGEAAVGVLTVLAGGRPVGYVQHYRLAEAAAGADPVRAIADPAAVGIDYLIGDPTLLGHGVGTRAVWAAVRHLCDVGPTVPQVVADPGADNPASARVLAKAGFTEIGQVPADHPGADGGRAPRRVMAFDVRHWLGAGRARR